MGDVRVERTVWRRPEDITRDDPTIKFIAMSESPADVAGQMVAGIVAGTLALRAHQSLPDEEVAANLRSAHRLFSSVMFAPQVCHVVLL